MTTSRIGQVSQQTGLSIDTIRFYEKQGILQRSQRTAGGFRLFGEAEVETLRFVRRAQELGFSLGEIRELLILRAEPAPACSHVKDLLDQKILTVRNKIKELQNLERGLNQALRKCKREATSAEPGHKACCPFIEQIGGGPRSKRRSED